MPRINPRQILSRSKQTTTRAIRKTIQAIRGKQNVHFLHIGKTGGTAIKYALTNGSANRRYVIHLHRHGFKLKDVPNGESFVFFLRDPITRFVSGFYSRQRQGQPRIFSPWSPGEKEAFERFGTANELAIALASLDEEEKAKAQRAMKSIQHVRNSYWDWFGNEQYFRSRSADIFFVGFQESLTEDFSVLRTRLGLPDDVTLPDDDIQAHKNPEHLETSLDGEAIENLKQWYKDDYRFLRLCKEFY